MTPATDKIYIIAEAGVNHNGSQETALELVDAAAQSGADAVKFQTFRAESVATSHAPKAAYQKRATTEQESQLEMIREFELSFDAHRPLAERCAGLGIEFLSTPFDHDSLAFLTQDLDVPLLKIASGEITNGPMLLAAARTGKDIILSTGMSTLADVEAALGVLAFGYTAPDDPSAPDAGASAFSSENGQRALRDHVTLLHCTTEYPAPFDEVNLKAMAALKETFDLRVGLSDHSMGIAVATAAAALGATVIEKHFTLDHGLPGPDHAASLEPDQLSDMVVAIRQVEAALGDGVKQPKVSERPNMIVARRSLVALKPIARGEAFSPENLGAKRPGDGVAPMHYWRLLGQTANNDYHEDESIKGDE